MLKFKNKKILAFCLILTATILRLACIRAESLSAAARTNNAIDHYIASLSDEQLITQMFAIGIDGSDCLHQYAKKEFAKAAPGSFLLFKSNIASTPDEVLAFTQSVTKWFIDNGLVPPLLMIDNEGGAVYRLQDVSSPLLSPGKTTVFFTFSQAEYYYELIGLQMRLLGLHLNLAPLVETKTKNNEAFLRNRSYGNLNSVLQYAGAAVRGFEKAGIGAVLKHFPGNTDIDPHSGLPKLSVPHMEYEEIYEKPFNLLLEQKPSAVLMSHIVVEQEDSGVPACLSSVLVTERLRRTLGFDGVIISDDLFMGALANNGYPPEKAVITAIKAGVDILMMSEKRYGSVYNAVYSIYLSDKSFRSLIISSVRRILQLKIKLGILYVAPTSEENFFMLIPVPLRAPETILPEYKQIKMQASVYFSDVINK